MCEEGWGQPPKVFSCMQGGRSHRQLKGAGRAPAIGAWGHGDGANRPSFPIRSSSRNGGSQAPSAAAPPLPVSEELDYFTSSLKLILDFPSLGGENEAES